MIDNIYCGSQQQFLDITTNLYWLGNNESTMRDFNKNDTLKIWIKNTQKKLA